MCKNVISVLLLLGLSLLACALPDESLYNLPSQWNDQSGRPLRLQQLGGKVQVLAMVYTHCQSVCPAIITAMKSTEARLSAAERARVGFVLVSIDPAVDTSEQLREFAVENKFGPGWILLRGAPEDVRELAATLNFKYRKTTQKDYAHTAMITVLDQQGQVVSQQLGMSGGAEERLSEIRKLLRR
ncbi:SCO family protein [bacterium]|nr:SCO family protein [bacterium]